MEPEHLEVNDLPEIHVEGQKEQLVVLPTQKMKEPFSGEIKLQGVEMIEHHTENVRKRTTEKLWLCQETVALLKIRSEMDGAFHDATFKDPLWKVVSRKLAQQGYIRSAENCKRKFYNLCSYYKRIKQGHAGHHDKKPYRLFSRLEALHILSPISSGTRMVGTSRRTHALPSGASTASPISATTTTLASTSTPNSESTPVSIGIRMFASSARIQSPHSDGTEAASHTYSRPSHGLSENSGEVVPASGGFLAKKKFGGEEAAPAVAIEDFGPCQETIALIKIRSEMDEAFRIATVKCPLWEVVSRKLAEQGYTIPAKTCKEKFETIQNYFITGRKIELNIKDNKSYHFFSQLDAPQIPTGAIATSLAATSTPKSAPNPVSTRTRMVGSSGRIQAFMSDPVIPTSTSTAATAHIKISQIIPPIVSGGSPTSITRLADANKDLKIIGSNCTHPFFSTVEEHQNLGLYLEKSNPPISTVSNGVDTEHETANVDLTIDQIDRTQSLSSAVEEHQTLSICMENNGDEAIASKNKSIESLEHNKSSNKLKRPFSLESKGNERALQSSFDVTTIANSFLLQEDERSLLLMNRSVPFIKTFHLWESIRSMEVFQLMPQHPHFHPLEKENEELREGIAIGHMLSFAKLIGNACQAQIGDPRSKFENKLKALTDLEELGFTVQLLRSQLEALLKIKDSYNQFDDKLNAAEAEIIDKKRQVDEIQGSIARLSIQLQELLMEKERKGSDVDELRRKTDALNGKLHRAKLDFGNLVAASW